MAAVAFAAFSVRAADTPGDGIAALLADAGIKQEQLDSLAGAVRTGAALPPADARTAEAMLFRLRQYGVDRLVGDARSRVDSDSPVEAIMVSGRVVQVEKIDVPTSDEPATSKALFRLTIDADGRRTVALAAKIPRGWANRTITADSAEPTRLIGATIRLPPENDANATEIPAVTVAAHVGWFPDRSVSLSWAWLAKHDFDIALLDEVRHGRRFVDERVSAEGLAFRKLLNCVHAASAEELASVAAQEIAARKEKLKRIVAAAELRYASLSKDEKTEAALAAKELERGAAGRSSVAPLFFHPRDNTGAAVVFEGIVRRAVRIADETEPGGTSHYELDLYPVDSQNLPVVCCVAQLPDGFPLGDSLREPAIVAGIFFKLWRFQGRPDADGKETLTSAPVVLACEPQWLLERDERASPWPGIIGGGVFLAAIVAMWIALVRSSRASDSRKTLPLPDRIDPPN